MRMAKILGYQVCTNTTVYKETDMQEVEDLLDFLGEFGVDGHTISPGYEYDAAKNGHGQAPEPAPEDFFLTREGTREKFKDMPEWSKRYSLLGTPDLPRVPRRTARAGMLRLGHPDAQHRRVAGAVFTSWPEQGISRPTRRCSNRWTGQNSASSPPPARPRTRAATTA